MWAYLLSITRIERSALLYVAAFSAVGFGHIGMVSVLGNLYVLGLGFDATFLGTLTATGQLVWALTALPAGEIGARFGLRGTMVTGYVLVALLFAAYLNVPLLPREAWGAGLLITNLLMWASVSLMSVNGVPYLMSIVPTEQRSTAFSFQAAVMPVMAFLGSLIGGFLPEFLRRVTGGELSDTGAYRVVLMLPAVVYFLSAGLLLKARPAPPLIQPSKEAAGQAAPLGLLVFLGVLFGLQIASEATLTSFLNVYYNKDLLVSTSVIGTIFALVRLMPFFLSPLLPLAFNRWGSGLTMMASNALLAVAAIGLALFPNWIAASVAFLLASVASSVANPARSLLGQESVLPRWRTTVNAVTSISLAMGGALAGYAGGRLIDLAGFRGLFLAGAGLALASVVMYAAGRRKTALQPAGAVGDVP